jgi:phosphatidate cytidylyltransferase
LRSDIERERFLAGNEIGPEQDFQAYDDYGDEHESPPGDRPPALSFPLSGTQDPNDIERSPLSPVDPVQLPHWTEPATGTVPGYFAQEEGGDEDLSAWSSLGSQPIWRGEEQLEPEQEYEFTQLGDESTRIGALAPPPVVEPEESFEFEPYDADAIFDDEEEEMLAPPRESRQSAVGPPGGGLDREEPYYERPRGAGRNMPLAIAMGVAMLALGIASMVAGPRYVVALVTVVVVLAVNELYASVLANTDLEPAWPVGVIATGGAVIAAYNYGEGALPLVLFISLAASLVWHLVGAASPDASALRGAASTVFGVVYVGMLGAYAGLMMGLPAVDGATEPGISFFLGAVLCTAGYDIGGFFVGRKLGSRPLSAASPNKTVEGLLGGMVGAFLVGLVVVSRIHPWGVGEGALLGLAVFGAACVGDLCESLVKRDLGIKDMSSLLPGHGGLLDRFDGTLFALPVAYYVGRIFFF